MTVSTPTDPNGHGTHVAGIIGACGNNNKGVTGTCWNVKLASLRVINKGGYGYISYFMQALDFANRNNIKIVNCSLRWWLDNTYFDTTTTELNAAIEDYGGLIVCAAGNEYTNTDSDNTVYLANSDANNIIAVGNSDANDLKASDSNYGTKTVDLFAPGENIYSTLTGGGYGCKSGTSMAAPFVTGVAALMLSYNPTLTATEIKNIILNNVDTSSSLSGLCVTGGRLNAYKALSNTTHSHLYGVNYKYTSNTYHKAYCVCGAYESQFHYTDRDHLNSSANTAVCLGCGATIDLSKSPILMTGLSDGVETASVGLNVISSMGQLMQALGITEAEASGEYSYIFDIYNEEFFGKYSIVTEMDIYENSELLKKAIIGTVKSDEYKEEDTAA